MPFYFAAFAIMKSDLLSGQLFTAHWMAFTQISSPLDEQFNLIYALIITTLIQNEKMLSEDKNQLPNVVSDVLPAQTESVFHA